MAETVAAPPALEGFRGVLQTLLTPACYETLLVRYDLLHRACLARAASKALGLGIVVGSAIVKVPQIAKIWSARSAEGSLLTFVLELVVHPISSASTTPTATPQHVGEMAFLAAQGVVLVALILHFTQRTISACLRAHRLAAGYILLRVARGRAAGALLSTVVIFVVSRLPQIAANYRAGST